MKSVICAVFICFAIELEAQPCIHVGADINFNGSEGRYETGNYAGYAGVLVAYSSSVTVDPINGSASWSSWFNAPSGSWAEYYDSVSPIATSVVWNPYPFDPPIGYDVPDAEWFDSHSAIVCNSNFSREIGGLSISPLNIGDVWIDWYSDSSLRIVWSNTTPVDFGKYLSDGSINPSWVEPPLDPVEKPKRGKGHNK